MKIKLGELLNKRASLNYLVDQSLPVMASFKLSKMVRLINDELIEYEKVRDDLVRKHGKEDKKTKFISIAKDSAEFESFQNELNPVLNAEVELNIVPIDISELGEELKIETKYLVDLVGFIINE